MLTLDYLCFLKKVYRKLKFPSFIVNFKNELIYKITKNRLFNYFKMSEKSLHLVETKNSEKIWLFWWQGYDKMPPIVSSCIKSVQRHSNGHEVVLITHNNLKDYTDISDALWNKFYNGSITITHFSDIARFNLLKNHGGLWVDATMFCTDDFNDEYFKSLYSSGGYHNTDPKFVDGRWTSFLIGGKANNALFEFMNSFYDLYWKDNDKVINYFIIDYGLEYAYNQNIGGFKNYVDNVAKNNNPALFDLFPLLNDDFNLNKYNELTKDTNMFKLSYKADFNTNSNTFYNKLILGFDKSEIK